MHLSDLLRPRYSWHHSSWLYTLSSYGPCRRPCPTERQPVLPLHVSVTTERCHPQSVESRNEAFWALGHIGHAVEAHWFGELGNLLLA